MALDFHRRVVNVEVFPDQVVPEKPLMLRGSLPVLAALVFIPSIASPQGSPLGPEFRVNTYATNDQLLPDIAVDPFGGFVVVWESYTQDGSSYGVFGQRYASSGAPLGPEFRVNTYTTGPQWGSSVATDSSGNFVVVWTSYLQDGSNYGVFGQRYANSGAPLGPEFRVNTYTTSRQWWPSVASDSSGDFVVVWQTGGFFGGPPGDVFGQRYASDGTPLGPEFRVNTYTTHDQFGGAVVMDPAGNFVVAWTDYAQDGSLYGVFGQRYASSGAPLGPEFRVNTWTTLYQGFPSVAMDSSGNFIVVWHSTQRDSASVYGQRYASSGTPLGAEFKVSTLIGNTQRYPSVAADSSGNFVGVWQSYLQDGSSYGVYAQRFASSGALEGPEFRVNTFTISNQGRPSVASDPAGSFVVVWHSNFQDGSSRGVYGQRYSQIVPIELLHFRVE